MRANGNTTFIRVAIWVLSGLVLALLSTVAYTTATLPGCKKCHDSKTFVQQTNAKQHSRIPCVRCHVAPGFASRVSYGFNIVFGMALKVAPSGGGEGAKVGDAACLSCHRAVLREVVEYNGLRIRHLDCAAGRLCTDCHSDTAHGSAVRWNTTINMNQCLDCHTTAEVRTGCDVCHREKSEEERINSGQWAITHNANWEQTHGMGDLNTCVACHPDNYCTRCHGVTMPHDTAYIRIHPAQARSMRDKCAVCHTAIFCENCHGLRMPHPASFVKKHSATVKVNGKKLCLRCHLIDDCNRCHDRHVHPGGATKAPQVEAP